MRSGRCEAPHPELPISCSRFKTAKKFWGEDRIHVHGFYDPETRTEVEWIEECGKRHQDRPTELCALPKGHRERQKAKVDQEKRRVTYGEMMKALRARHAAKNGVQQYAYFEELRIGTGFGGFGPDGQDAAQQIDAWAIHLWPSRDFLRISYEVKMSKQDYKREIENPAKRQAAMAVSNLYYFVAPDGVIDSDTVPADCGLLVFDGIKLKTVVPAPMHPGREPTWRFFASFARRELTA